MPHSRSRSPTVFHDGKRRPGGQRWRRSSRAMCAGTPEETVIHRSVRLGDFKLVSPENTHRHAELTTNWPMLDVKKPDLFTDLPLFNLRADPGEKTNLAHNPAHAAIRDQLIALLGAWWPMPAVK